MYVVERWWWKDDEREEVATAASSENVEGTITDVHRRDGDLNGDQWLNAQRAAPPHLRHSRALSARLVKQQQ